MNFWGCGRRLSRGCRLSEALVTGLRETVFGAYSQSR